MAGVSSVDFEKARWRDTIYNSRPGAGQMRSETASKTKFPMLKNRVRSKAQKLQEIEDDIDNIEAKLRQ